MVSSVQVTHSVVSNNGESPDPTVLGQAAWNAPHVVQMSGPGLVGASAAGPAQVVGVGAGLGLSGGNLGLLPVFSNPPGNLALNFGNGALQSVPNVGAFAITASARDGSCVLLVSNGVGAGTVAFSGFARVTGDLMDTVNGDKFFLQIECIGGVSVCTVTAAQTVLGMPAGALGIWYMDQYQFVQASPSSGVQGKKVVPNAASTVPISTNLTICPRSFFNGTVYWINSGCTVVDNNVAGPDAVVDASTVTVLASQNPWYIQSAQFPNIQNGYLPAGTYTIGVNVKLVSGAGTFVLGTFFVAPVQSGANTPTSSWQRFSFTFTTAGGSVSGATSIIGMGGVSVGSFVLAIRDLTIYPGSVDLGAEVYAGHLQASTGGTAGLGTDANYSYAGGLLTARNGGSGNINFPFGSLPANCDNVTVIACTFQPAYVVTLGGAIPVWFCSSVDDAFWAGPGLPGAIWEGVGYPTPGIGTGLGSSNGNNSQMQSYPTLFDNFNQQLSVIAHTWNFGTLTAEGWVNGTKLLKNVMVSALHGSGLQDLNFNMTVFHDHYSSNVYSSIAIYQRTLSDAEIAQATRYMAYRASLSALQVGRAQWVLAVGDEMVMGLWPYLAAQNITGKIHGANYGYTGANAADAAFAAVLSRVNSVVPPPTESRICVVYVGSHALGTGNAAAVAAQVAAACDTLRSAGTYVIACTLYDYYYPANQAQFDMDRAAFNATVRTWLGVHADIVADLASVANVGGNGNHTNATYFVQPSGPQTPAADALLAPLLVSAIGALPA